MCGSPVKCRRSVGGSTTARGAPLRLRSVIASCWRAPGSVSSRTSSMATGASRQSVDERNVHGRPSMGTLANSVPAFTRCASRRAFATGVISRIDALGSARIRWGKSSAPSDCRNSGTSSSSFCRMRPVRNATPSSNRSTSGSTPRSASIGASVGYACENSRPSSRRYASSSWKYLLNMCAPTLGGGR